MKNFFLLIYQNFQENTVIINTEGEWQKLLNKVSIKIIFGGFIIIQDEIAVLEISDPWSGLDPFKMMLIKGNFQNFCSLIFEKMYKSSDD